MKHFKFIFSFLFALSSFCISAETLYFADYAFSIISEKEKLCALEQNENNPYKGDFIIPNYIPYNGVEYMVYQVNSYAFNDCNELTSLTIPSSLKAIKKLTFGNNSQLSKIYILDSDESLSFGYGNGNSNSPFSYNTPLNYIYLGRNIDDIADSNGKNAIFQYMPIKEIYMSDNVTTIGKYMFSHCREYDGEIDSGIKKIRFSNSLKSIGVQAFSHHSLDFKELIFPESLVEIGANAFYNEKAVSEIVFGSNLTSLGYGSFCGFENLATVYCYAVKPPTANGAAWTYELATARLRVPAESIDAYKNANGWSSFGEILPIEESSVQPTYPLHFTIHFPESGTISQNINKGQSLSLYIKPSDGWNLHSVSHNGEDVTNLLSNDGLYVTEPIYEDTDLHVVFKEDTNTSIASHNSDNTHRVIISDRTIHIYGNYDNAALYKADGRIIESSINETFSVNYKGIFILVIDGVSYKFAI